MKNEKKVVQTVFAINVGGFRASTITVVINSGKYYLFYLFTYLPFI